MSRIWKLAAVSALLLLLQGCRREQAPEPDSAVRDQPASGSAPVTGPQPYIVEIRALGKTFEGAGEIPSGWITFRFVNASPMTHFAMIDVPPDSVSIQEMSDTVMVYFQEAMDAMNSGDEAGVNTAFGKFPTWISELVRHGGPGMLSPGRSGESTVFMEPGRYMLECYVKSDGVFHSTPPAEGQLGMVMGLTVTEEPSGSPEPEANATLSITNAGFALTDGELNPGKNTIRVDFVEQQALPSFVGNDVHIMRVDNDESIPAADGWLDWRTPEGLEDPSPVEFLGGLNDMPAGSHGYFTVDLDPGEYAFVAEIPGPQASGFVLPFVVDENQ